MSYIVFVFLVLMLPFACFTVYLVAHEVTHLAFSEEAHGICIGHCYTGKDGQASIGTAWAANYPALSQDERLPHVLGGSLMLSVVLTGLYINLREVK